MAKKLNSMPDFTARMPKSAHDVSQALTYTSCPGMLSPVYFDLLHLGDEIHFSASEFVRLNPLEAMPLGSVDVHLDYFFVPLTVLYTPISSLFYETDDLLSSLFDRSNLFLDCFPAFQFDSWLSTNFTEYSNHPTCVSKDCVLDETAGYSARHLNSGAFDCLGSSIYRMWDFLDMSPNVLLDSISHTQDAQGTYISDDYPKYTPWFALAYQAIYQLYFRNDDREKKNYHYNIDKYYDDDSLFTEDLMSGYKKSIFQINYASRPKDYFNSVKVSPISSSVSMLGGNILSSLFGRVNNWLSTSGSVTVSNTGSITNVDGATSISNSVANGSSISPVYNTSQIRQLFMVEKLLRVIGRSEKNYESQFLAHYGIKVPHDAIHNITHIGHDMITIKPESVISQANTWNGNTGSALGEIGGKASGMLTGRKHNFNAPFVGIFMCISHIIPRRRYVAGLNKLHQLNSQMDFWQPEFDKKGMQPLFGYEGEFSLKSCDSSVRLGWQFAYEQFKRKYDRVSHAFENVIHSTGSVNSYSPWVIANRPFGMNLSNGNNLVTWQSNLYIAMQDLLVSPNDLNLNMVVPHSTLWPSTCVDYTNNYAQKQHQPWLIYQTDPFIIDFYMYCKKVNGMSEYGEPEL